VLCSLEQLVNVDIILVAPPHVGLVRAAASRVVVAIGGDVLERVSHARDSDYSYAATS